MENLLFDAEELRELPFNCRLYKNKIKEHAGTKQRKPMLQERFVNSAHHQNEHMELYKGFYKMITRIIST